MPAGQQSGRARARAIGARVLVVEHRVVIPVEAIHDARDPLDRREPAPLRRAEHRLVGVLSLRSLILANAGRKLRDLMVQSVVRTQIDSSPEEVAQVVSKYDLLSVPVVDMQNTLVGVVTVDDVLDHSLPRDWRDRDSHDDEQAAQE